MRPHPTTPLLLFVAAASWLSITLAAQRLDVFVASRDHAAIAYSKAPTQDAVAALNARLRAGSATLRFDETSGYLRSVLEALRLPVESQSLVFSPTSFHASLISMRNPRALYFNDAVTLGWVRGADALEAAAVDPRQGVIFYELAQKAGGVPQFTRNDRCLTCHLSWDSLGVPGLLALSTGPRTDEQAYATGFVTDHRSPLRERWGGWYVTGSPGTGGSHMGNLPVAPEEIGKGPLVPPTRVLTSVEGLFDVKGYPSLHSDVAALLVLGHQAHAVNLITRAGWEGRVAGADGASSPRVRDAVSTLADYLLFIDEAPLNGVRGSSAFAATFATAGPADTQGRSLRELDLRRRLFRYPCSYMIYSAAFDALPGAVRDAVYARLWHVLSGEDRAPRYRSLTLADRTAAVEILRGTKPGLPAFFGGAIR